MKGYCLQGDMDKAQQVFDQMEVEGNLPDTFSYNTLVYGYIKVKRADTGLKLLKDMTVKGLLPDQLTRDILKNILSKRLVESVPFVTEDKLAS